MDAIETAFGAGKSLYEVLEVPTTASAEEIKKGYFRIALKCHPDKCPGDDEAKARFQALSRVHAVLSDPDRRALYDESGEINEESYEPRAEGTEVWSEYWRSLFPKITIADIHSFSDKYKGSDEETQDVLEAYTKCKGNICSIIDSVMLATDEDEDRFRKLIEQAIKRKAIARFEEFNSKGSCGKSSGAMKIKAKRKSKMDKEAKEAEELMATIRQRGEERVNGNTLAAHRSRQFESMVSSLEKRYGGPGAGKGGGGKRVRKSPALQDIDDARFEQIQKSLGKKRGK